jgi:hypothetical protein
VSLRLLWEPQALEDLAAAAEWSQLQARAVVQAMERMAELGWSLGKSTGMRDERYWPVRPLGVFYRVAGPSLMVMRVIDLRRWIAP